MNISLQEIVFLYRRSLYHCLFHFSCHYRKNPACRYLSAVRSFRYGSHLRNPGLYLPERCTADGLRRRYRGAVCILHPADPVGQEYEVQNKPRQAHQCIADHCYRCSSRAFLSYDQRICPEPDSTGSRTSGRKHRTCLDWYREIPVCITI